MRQLPLLRLLLCQTTKLVQMLDPLLVRAPNPSPVLMDVVLLLKRPPRHHLARAHSWEQYLRSRVTVT